MKNYGLVLWDLDGTMIDPAEGILHSVVYALKKMGYGERSNEYLRQFIGPPLFQSFRELIGMNGDEAKRAVYFYRENYSGNGAIHQNQLYEGISDLIREVHRRKRRQIVVTSKPTVFASQIVKFHNLEAFFSEIVGSNLDGSMSNKSDLFKYALERFPSYFEDEAIAIGDRKYEVEAANENGIDSIGVLYGYGTPEEIQIASPTFIANNVAGIGKILLD